MALNKVVSSTMENFSVGVGIGDITGIISAQIRGLNVAVGTSFEEVWGGAIPYPFAPTGQEEVNIKSTNANDTSAGTGARFVNIFGLSQNHGDVTELIAMNGTTDVLSVNAYQKINKVEVRNVGSNGSNLGLITVTNTPTGNLLGRVEIGINNSEAAIYTIPNSTSALIYDFYASSPSGTKYTVELISRPQGEAFLRKDLIHGLDDGSQHSGRMSPIVVPSRSDIVVRAKMASGTGIIYTGFNIIIADKDPV